MDTYMDTYNNSRCIYIFMNSFNSKNNSNNTTIRDFETFYKIILEMPGINKKDMRPQKSLNG